MKTLHNLSWTPINVNLIYEYDISVLPAWHKYYWISAQVNLDLKRVDSGIHYLLEAPAAVAIFSNIS